MSLRRAATLTATAVTTHYQRTCATAIRVRILSTSFSSSFSSSSSSANKAPPDTATLYNRLVHPTSSAASVRRKARSSATSDAAVAARDEELAAQIARAHNTADPERAVALVRACLRDDVDAADDNGHADETHDRYVPRAYHIASAVSACITHDAVETAEHLLDDLCEHPSISDDLNPARASLARYHITMGAHTKALVVLRVSPAVCSRPPAGMYAELEPLRLGASSGPWGAIIKALLGLGYPKHACVVADAAIAARASYRLPPSDALLHLTLDALRRADRGAEAHACFQDAVRAGLAPSERTVASLLLALASRAARSLVSPEIVVNTVDLVENPSRRFLRPAIMALTSVGAVDRAYAAFVELSHAHQGDDQEDRKTHDPYHPDEQVFGMLLAGLGNRLELLPAEHVDGINAATHDQLATQADTYWEMYRAAFPTPTILPEILAKLLRVKTRCFRHGDAVEILESLASNDTVRNAIDIRHVAGVLGAIELRSDTQAMQRLIGVMKRLQLEHDLRSLAFCLGTLLGDGALAQAVEMVREEMPEHLNGGDNFREYFPRLLARRLRSLQLALCDAGIGSVKHVDEAFLRVKALQEEFEVKEERESSSYRRPSSRRGPW